MNKNVIIYLIIILNLISYSFIDCSTICSIFPTLNCSCFQSDFDLLFPSPIKTYSHLYCQGISLNTKTLQSPFGADLENQHRFRTISLEFFLNDQNVEIHRNQFDSLPVLFSQTHHDAQIEIAIRLNGFNQIHFHQQSLTANMFQEKHQKKHLSVHLIPKTMKDIQKESGEDDFTAIDKQLKFSENCFSGLILSQLNLFIHTYKEYFPSFYPFEYLFNNTHIGELHFHGSIIPPGSSSLRRTFKGLVRSLTLHRHVDTIDSTTFPYYFPVYSYNIHSHEAHTMDLDSFIPLYNNLRGLILIKPRFEVSIDRFIPTLDYLLLDIEHLNERTLLSARHINNFKLGPRLRRIDPLVLHSLTNRLKTFDLSQIDLSQMTPESLCHLIHFIYHNYRRSIHLILPRIEYLTECDCARLMLHDMQQMRSDRDNSICSKQCRFSDCSVISGYFREKYPLFLDDNRPMNMFNDTNGDLPSVDLFADPLDIHMMSFLVNQTNNQYINQNQRSTTILPIATLPPLTGRTLPPPPLTRTRTLPPPIVRTLPPLPPPVARTLPPLPPPIKNLVIFEDLNSVDEQTNELEKSKPLIWISLLIGIVVAIFILILFISLILIFVRCKKQKRYKPVPVPVYV